MNKWLDVITPISIGIEINHLQKVVKYINREGNLMPLFFNSNNRGFHNLQL